MWIWRGEGRRNSGHSNDVASCCLPKTLEGFWVQRFFRKWGWCSLSLYTYISLQCEASEPQHCWHLDWIIFVIGSCPTHPRMFSSVPGLCPLDAISIPLPVVTTKTVSRYCQMSLGDKTCALLRVTDFSVSQSLDTCLVPYLVSSVGLFA